MEKTDEFPDADAPPTLAELAASLEHAAQMAKRIPTATDPSHLQQIYNSLTAAHQNLSSFLCISNQNPNLPPPPPDEYSEESAINSSAEPMQVGEEEEAEARKSKSEAMMDEVEEKMRDFFIRNKRPKRPISPSAAAAAERTRLFEDGFGDKMVGRFDPNATRLRNLELIYQFHC